MSCPYDDLYIYHLNGRLTSQRKIPQRHFIGNWEEDNFSFLFFSQPAFEDIQDLLRTQPQLSYIDSYHMPYAQWQGSVFSSFDHGPFQIMAPWENQNPKQSDKLSLILDPGLVFGTGTHPTTRDCLDALQLACRRHSPTHAMDLGTGTGILALAAARLGCKLILAVDLNLLAATTAAKNVRLNHLEQQVLVTQGYAEDFIDYPAELVVANVHYAVMQKLIQSKAFRTKKCFILSGLMRSEAKQVKMDLERLPAKILKSWTHKGIWHTFYGEFDN
ncbi:MAG: 50S ribosomal protein L11 methyltransferase [Desulfobacterales bacterium]|nr:50S ribosomal protein L11 methyltransferase [Desulfobacterales bacterium]